MYNHKEIEKKWQEFWKKNKTFKVENDFTKPKYYTLDMFPYPSWAWLHVWHPEWYTANDIIARYKNAKWFNVLHPMWRDAFWLPAENYAIKTWTHPRITTDKNINQIMEKIKGLWFSYDWDREIDTTDPDYYKWTQWIFLKLFEKGLAYEQDLPINYCPSCKTGLANEEVLKDFSCERCWEQVEKKKIRQWVLAITKYADRLLKDVDKLDWPESIKEMQRNWIGKSEGCEFEMKLAKLNKKNEACISKGVGLNCPAKTSLESSIFNTSIKVKKKTHFLNKIEWLIINDSKKILFNSENILKHFKSKNTKEFHYRKNLLWTIFYNLNNLKFNNNVGYFIFKNMFIKVVLWQQSNWNYFVKTYYVDDKLTNLYNNSSSENLSISVYTTRIDTVFGMTYAVLAPDHKDVYKFITSEQKKVCEQYIKKTNSMSDQDRTADDKEKTGVFTWSYVVNPFNGEKVPLWIGDYVLWNYWTWAVMAVPAHDERDFEFARKYGLEIKNVVINNGIPVYFPCWLKKTYSETEEKQSLMIEKTNKLNLKIDDIEFTKKVVNLYLDNYNEKELYFSAFTYDWVLVNSWIFSWLKSEQARKELTEYAEKNNFWNKKVNYKLRDWLFSRQRYWGEPIPLIHLEEKKIKNLPQIKEGDFEKIFNKKMRIATLNTEGVTPMGNTAKFSSTSSIFESIEEVKKINKKIVLRWFLENYKTKKWNIIVNWRYLEEHFKIKSRTEKNIRKRFSYTIFENLDKVYYFSENMWLIDINWYLWIIILEKTNNKNEYNLLTYYFIKSINDIYKNAYISKQKAWNYLYIWWKAFSKIYEWLYGKMVCDYNLPLKLPEVENYEPAGDWNSPLVKVEDFVNIKLASNLSWKRETNTMPQWGWSCWYYLRYMDPKKFW